jgi:hypothetical protein
MLSHAAPLLMFKPKKNLLQISFKTKFTLLYRQKKRRKGKGKENCLDELQRQAGESPKLQLFGREPTEVNGYRLTD